MDALEKRWNETEERRRSRALWWTQAVALAVMVALLTMLITLAATGNLHHH